MHLTLSSRGSTSHRAFLIGSPATQRERVVRFQCRESIFHQGLEPGLLLALPYAIRTNLSVAEVAPIGPRFQAELPSLQSEIKRRFCSLPVAGELAARKGPILSPGMSRHAIFFTADLDSFWRFHRNPRRPGALIFITEEESQPSACERWIDSACQMVAKQEGLPLLRVETNARNVLAGILDPDATMALIEAAVAALLSPAFDTFSVPNTDVSIDNLRTAAANALGVQLISPSRTDCVVKCEALREDSTALSNLIVCREPKRTSRNCGGCFECGLTWAALTAIGANADRQLFGEAARLGSHRALIPLNVTQAQELKNNHEAFARLPRHAGKGSTFPSAHMVVRESATKTTWPARTGLIPRSAFSALQRLLRNQRVYFDSDCPDRSLDCIFFRAAVSQMLAGLGIPLSASLSSADKVLRICALSGPPGGRLNSGDAESYRLEICTGDPGQNSPQCRALVPVPNPVLAFDLYMEILPAIFTEGVFLSDAYTHFYAGPASQGSPSRHAADLPGFFRVAMRYARIITDSPYFAIAGMLVGREVFLADDTSGSNLRWFQDWLGELGCQWLAPTRRVPDFLAAPFAVRGSTYHRQNVPRLAMAMCIHNEEHFLMFHLKVHRWLGISRAYLFLDRCTDTTAQIARDEREWITVIEANSPECRHYFREHQCSCLDHALALARKDGVDWLLSIDPDEFAFPEWTGVSEMDLKGSLPALAAAVPDDCQQVVFSTKESLPVRSYAGKSYWENPYFVRQVFTRDLLNPITGQRELFARLLGHNDGKAMVRTAADVQSFNAHRWTRAQNVAKPYFPELLDLPTVVGGFHYHFVVTRHDQWLKKYRSFERHHRHWPMHGGPVQFPKKEWTEAAATMTAGEAFDYLHENVFFSEEQAEAMTAHGVLSKETILPTLAAKIEGATSP